MRGKRSKQYRKLMEQYCMTFGFREPYQVIVDAEIVKDSCQFKMDLAPALQRTVHGPVKPMITQCEIRKLYENKKDPGVNEAIELAKTFERRRCGHHPDEYPKPLSTEECLESVVDPKSTGENKHRYVVASQSQSVRRLLRSVRAVPLIYIKRSVMILEPMADESAQVRAKEERSKFRAELKKMTGKRKRDERDEAFGVDNKEAGVRSGGAQRTTGQAQKKKHKGPKGPNPLSVKKATKKFTDEGASGASVKSKEQDTADAPAKKKRRRKRKDDAGNDGKDESKEDAGISPPTTAAVEVAAG